jgi:transcriptional regulator with XRE-family HTH domain
MQTMDIASRFAENIVRCRKRADLSQEELGVRASLHRTEISQLERGLRLARIDTLVKLAGGLSVSPMELLDGIDWTPGRTTYGEFTVAAAAAAGED